MGEGRRGGEGSRKWVKEEKKVVDKGWRKIKEEERKSIVEG